MSASVIIFYCISALILTAGVVAVTARKIFRAAIGLLFSLIGIAALFFWMDVNFLAAVQIVVYVGGIVVLIIFSIFLTDQSGSELPKPILKRQIFSILSVVFAIAFVCNLINRTSFYHSKDIFDTSVKRIGNAMLDTNSVGYALPFEVVSILLLAAMIGSIVIAMKSKNTKQEKLK
ncbi:MAG: NADH-quinone oxidoreductase subunit J [Chitinophagaceae bacterium]|nr:NADH-quinone oxidoreductase subunit J [Chitinophagaceae bacterium]